MSNLWREAMLKMVRSVFFFFNLAGVHDLIDIVLKYMQSILNQMYPTQGSVASKALK